MKSLPKPVSFGDQVTGDHLIDERRDKESSDYAVSYDDEFPDATAAVVLYDRATRWVQGIPSATRSHEDTVLAFKEFAGDNNVSSFYADNAPELKKAARELQWVMSTSTPGFPQTNGLVERMVRLVKEGTRCNLVQSGLHKRWWTYAMTAFCFAKNTEGADSAYERRYGVQSNHLRNIS